MWDTEFQIQLKTFSGKGTFWWHVMAALKTFSGTDNFSEQTTSEIVTLET